VARLAIVGLLSALFFSSTFVLNRLMSVQGGHWVWSASLRYVFMALFLLFIIITFQGWSKTKALFTLFRAHALFFCVAGSVGFGGFYALLCFSADYSPSWVIAATWQFMVIASLFVLMLFGRRFPKRVWVFAVMIVSGVVILNASQVASIEWEVILKGALPVLLASFCYPFGNQLIWEAKHGNRYFPKIESTLLDNAFNKVFLLTLGSIPFWVILLLWHTPALPSSSQVLHTAMVAFLAGIVATTLFLYARSHALSAAQIAFVDAIQAAQVIFALLGEMLFLGSDAPSTQAWLGMSFIFVGLGFFILFREKGVS
jgi:drug/metabolite transporter (DMT)-like permease